MPKQVVLARFEPGVARFEPGVARFGPSKVTKCFENWPIWDEKWVKNGLKARFAEMTVLKLAPCYCLIGTSTGV